MAVLLARNSESPTINNNDYARMMRYACSGYNGITKWYGQECSISSSGSAITISSGEIVYHGWQTVISASGERLNVDVVNEQRYYSLYLEINLSVLNDQKSIFKMLYSTIAYPDIHAGDDLTINHNGIARILIAHFKATSGVITSIERVIGLFGVGDVPTQSQSDISKKIANTEYVRKAVSEIITVKNAEDFVEGGKISKSLDDKAEFYKGSDSATLDYPLGTVFFCELTGSAIPMLNYATVNVYTNKAYKIHAKFGVSVDPKDPNLLLGKWVSRGTIEIANIQCIAVQRIA